MCTSRAAAVDAAEAPTLETPCNPIISEGDGVILFAGFGQVYFIDAVKNREIVNMKVGNIHHSDIIGLHYGSKVYDRKTQRWCVVLRPTPYLLTDAIRHRTQIIYQTDCNTLLMLLDAAPGKVIIESGTGSGSFTVNLARAVSPGGHIHTFEYHASRFQEAQKEFRQYKLDHVITCHYRDVCQSGFNIEIKKDFQCSLFNKDNIISADTTPIRDENSLTSPTDDVIHRSLISSKHIMLDTSVSQYADSLFLDLPQPWKALDHIETVLKPLGRLVTFSPCIEQIQKTMTSLRTRGYTDLRVFESLSKPWATTLTQSRSIPTQDLNNSIEQTELPGQIELCSNKTYKKRKRNEQGEDTALDKKIEVDFENLGYSQHQYPMRGHTSYLLLGISPPATCAGSNDTIL